MPHLIIEHSKSISLKTSLNKMAKELHYGFAQLETVKLEAVKTRTISSENCFIGDESKKEFLYLKVLLLKGRSDELKSKFVEKLSSILTAHVFQEKCSICIEIVELQHYYKLSDLK